MDKEKLKEVKKKRNILAGTAIYALLCYGFATYFLSWGWLICCFLPICALMIIYYLLKINSRIREFEEKLRSN